MNPTENPTPSVPSASEYTFDNFEAADRIAASTIHLAHFLSLRSNRRPVVRQDFSRGQKTGRFLVQ